MNTNSEKNIYILGAGPAGLALAMRLLKRNVADWKVTVIEQKPYVGGIAASFKEEGLYMDYGSHRLHPATSPEIMAELKSLLGDDLKLRPRNGRIRLMGKFVKFPLNPVDLMLHMPPRFFIGMLKDMLTKPFRKKKQQPENFADVLMDGLGPTVCNSFYFPYAKKLWGLEPEEISIIQAQRRVAANSVGKILIKIISLLPGIKKGEAGKFYYPLQGFGEISEKLADKVRELGGEILLSTSVKEIKIGKDAKNKLLLEKVDGTEKSESWQESDFIFSSIPLTVLGRLIKPEASAEIGNAASKLKFRSMVLHYLFLETDQFTPYDAHYVPESGVYISRISEHRNYSDVSEPKGVTGICSEIPCQVGDDLWNMPDETLTQQVVKEFETIGLPVSQKIRKAFTKKLPFVYPVYDRNFELAFEKLDAFVSQQPGLISLGRQGLFAHDNTHHTIETANAACDCLADDMKWDHVLWQQHREEFERHVVED